MSKVSPELIRIAARQVRVWRGSPPSAPDAPNLLLIHGGLGDAQWHWHTVWEPLADSFNLAAPDLPRFGGTGELPNASFQELIEWLARVQELVGMAQAAVVGNSFGAGLARLYAAAYPERVTHLILVDGGQIARPPKLMQRVMSTPFLAPFYEMVRQQSFSETDIRRAFGNDALVNDEVIKSSQAASHGFITLMQQLSSGGIPSNQTPRAPALLVWGERDRVAPIQRAQDIAAEIAVERLAVIKNAGHLPQIQDPLSFVRIVRDFCGE